MKKKYIKINKSLFKKFNFKILPGLSKSIEDCPVCKIRRHNQITEILKDSQELVDSIHNQQIDNLKLKINKPYEKMLR
jgi:hypothetical protein